MNQNSNALEIAEKSLWKKLRGGAFRVTVRVKAGGRVTESGSGSRSQSWFGQG